MGTARKDCFGTAANTGSKAWYTVADGVLSDVYSPTIENSNDATLQYIVTDGRSFTALQQRDMTYTVSSPDPSGMVCEVTSTDAAHGFKLVTDYLADPSRDSVVMRARLPPLGGASVTGLKVYARWDATIDNTGGGGASDTQAPSGPVGALVTEAAGVLAADHGGVVHVVHTQEEATAGDVAIDGESLDAARAVVRNHLDQLAARHVPAEGHMLLHAADHGAAGRMVAEYANTVGASTIVVGAATHRGLPALMDDSATRELSRLARSDIMIVSPDAPGRLIAADGYDTAAQAG